MTTMTTHERMTRIFNHQEADRVPITDSPWGSTVERWHKEGMPEGVDFSDYFGLDRFASIGADNGPRYPAQVLEETDEYVIATSSWGVTMKGWKHAGGVPEFLDFKIKDPDSWAEAKARMTPSRDRVNWDSLKRDYAKWREAGTWITGLFWFGFDVTHSWTMGTERTLMAMVTDPEWVKDIFNHCLDVQIALFDMIWDEGYHFDSILWYDDMGYKYHQFFSMNTYRELLKPAHKRACDWARSRGIQVELHSCGDVRPFVPELIEIGVGMLNPVEVKAGMDPVALKKQYGDKLAFHGGINAVLYNDLDALFEEMRQVIPVMKQNGGYVISSDHSVPDSVSLQDFKAFVDLARELGSY